MPETKKITVETIVKAPLAKVWESWTEPAHITKWCFAADDWEAPSATNDLRVGGRFGTRMSAKDKSSGFDFGGVYSVVEDKKRIAYQMDGADQRQVEIIFSVTPNGVKITETFDMEHSNSEELQRQGWQAILENFKKYTEILCQK